MSFRFDQTRAQIARMTTAWCRPADSVRLIAVSKQHSADKVADLARLGQRDFAENYLQEGLEKITQVNHLLPKAIADSLCWHFIGHVQSRKCRLLAERFDWVHSVDSIKVADKLHQYRSGDPINVLIQLNLQQEQQKSGVSAQDLLTLAKHILELPNLRLRGLMTVAKLENDFAKQRAAFGRCRELFDTLNLQGFNLDHLSMGMSATLEAAIAEGSTMVRLGTALFGPRPGKTHMQHVQ